MKNRNAIASYLMTVPGILAVAAIILYTRVMYTMAPVYFMLGGVIVLVALGFVIARKFPRISNYIPVCVSVLLASAAVWGSELMVNQIGYVVAGLDGVETIISWIVYLTLVIIALIVSLVASFLPMTKPETDPAVLAAQTAAGRKKIGRILTAALAVLLAAAIACTCIFYNQASGLRKQLATVTSEAASTKASLESKLNDAEGRASRLQSQVAGMFTQADVDQKVAEAVEAAKAEFQAAMPAAETAQEPAIDYSALPFAPVFAPNEAYDEFTTVAYTIEDIGAELACTVSRKADGSEYYVECNFYGDDQMTRTSYDGNEFVILEDKTGFMGGSNTAILQKAIEQNIWLPTKAQAASAAVDTSVLPFAPVFAPNEAYDEYTTVAYTIEDIGADLACTVSRKADGSEYYLECNFYGDDQMTRTTYDGSEFTILEDKTGFMGGSNTAILQKAIEQNIWLPTKAPAAASAAVDTSVLPFAPVFAPNEAYDEYTTVPYTIEDIGAELECTVSRKADGSEYYLECNFYGDDQMTRTSYDGNEFVILEDKTGFMGGNTPDILKKAMDQNIWLPIHGATPAAAEPAADPASALPFAPVFAPNEAYDEYTTVPYTIEDIGAKLECTVSRKADGSEYYLECNFYGDDQMTRTTYDGSEFTILEDKTGFMGGNTPDILKKAMDQNIWLPIHGDAPAAAAPAAEPAADPASALPFAPVFAPNAAYDEYTTVPYTIEDIGAELECTVSRKADGSEYYLECNFYGDDQMTRTTYDGSEFTILEDKTGFMGGNTPDILKKAIEQNIWLPIAK